MWLEVTGDTYIVDVRPVLSPEKISNYLEKYFVKGMEVRHDLETLGFLRRYSRSNNWPSAKLTLKGIDEGALEANGWQPFAADTEGWMAANSVGDPLLERNGTDLALALGDRAGRKRALKVLKGFKYDD